MSLNKKITEPKQPKEALMSSEWLTQAILDQSFQFIGLMTTDGILIKANQTALEFSGIEASSVLNKPFWQGPWWTHSPVLQEKLCQAVEKAARGEVVRFEATHVAKDGILHYVDFSLKPVKDETGKIIFLIPEGRDITEFKQEGMDLRDSEFRLRTIIEGETDGIIFCETDTYTITFANEAMMRLFGYPEEVIVGMNIQYLFPKDDWDTLKNEFGQDIAKEATALTSVSVIKKDGRLFFVDIASVNIKIKGKKYFVAFFRDLTERKRAEEMLKDTQGQLFQSSKMASLGQLSAGTAHEINNPLAAILGFAEAALIDLGNQKIDSDKISSDLKIILKNAERCKVIVSNLMNFARAKELQRKEDDVNSLIDDSLALLEYRFTVQDIKVVKKYADNLPKVSIDRDQITQVLINVISNAQIAMPNGGELFVSTWLENNFVLIEFKDTGIGIEKENLLKVFDPFFTTRRPGQGVGLGLSVSYSIMKSHNGYIYVKSDGPNKGASFIIKLPI